MKNLKNTSNVKDRKAKTKKNILNRLTVSVQRLISYKEPTNKVRTKMPDSFNNSKSYQSFFSKSVMSKTQQKNN